MFTAARREEVGCGIGDLAPHGLPVVQHQLFPQSILRKDPQNRHEVRGPEAPNLHHGCTPYLVVIDDAKVVRTAKLSLPVERAQLGFVGEWRHVIIV